MFCGFGVFYGASQIALIKWTIFLTNKPYEIKWNDAHPTN